MMEDTRAVSNVAVYVEHGVDKIDLDLVEAPPALSLTQHDEEAGPIDVTPQDSTAKHSKIDEILVDVNIVQKGDAVEHE